MSNFICSECGTTYIDCGGAGYKTLREIELEKKLDIAVKALEWYADYTNSTKGVFNMKPEKEAQQALKEMEGVE